MFGIKLKERAENQGLQGPTVLANAAHTLENPVSYQTVQAWFKRKNPMDPKYWPQLMAVLMVDVKFFTEGIQPVHGNIKATLPAFAMKSTGTTEVPAPEPPNFGPAPYPPKEPHNVPIISWVQAGDWQNAEDPFQPGQADEWLVTVETSSASAFALIVCGDSMEPVFTEGEIITVDPDLEPRNSDYIIAKNGNEATFKQLILDGSSVYLKPANERYPIKDMTGVDFVVVGVVVEKRKKFR